MTDDHDETRCDCGHLTDGPCLQSCPASKSMPDDHPDTLDTCAQPGCRNPVTTYEHLPPSDVCSVNHGIRKAERARIEGIIEALSTETWIDGQRSIHTKIVKTNALLAAIRKSDA